MVRTNIKKIMAFALATTMVIGSSVTVFAEGTAKTADGTSSFEGVDINFAQATSLTVPAVPTTGFGYIADPNGLIKESASSRYANSTWADTAHGVFFKTSSESGNTVYSEKSAALEVVNNNAAPIIVSAKIKQLAAGTNVIFTDDATFGGTTPSTAKSVYIAVTDGTNTKALKAGGAEVELPISVSGKVGNYELKWNAKANSGNGAYEYTLKTGIATTDKDKWNKTAFYVTGALNENAEWTGASDTFPTLTVTWDVAAGAAPIKIKNGKAASGTLTHQAATTIKSIKAGDTELDATVVGRTAPTQSAGAVLSFTAATAASIYEPIKALEDGLMLTVEYADGYIEPVVIFAR